MRKKTGQVTVFLIICIVLIFLFSSFYYIYNNFIAQTTSQTIAKTQLGAEEILPIKQEVKYCLDLAARKGLALLGDQGWVIYDTQGGPTKSFNQVCFGVSDYPPCFGQEYLRYEDKDVPYSVVGPMGDLFGFYKSSPPEYPWAGFPETQCITQPCSPGYNTLAFAGYNRLTHLTKTFSRSIQEQLEVYITNKMQTCVRWQDLSKGNIRIRKSGPNTTVTVNLADVTVQLNWPINLSNTVTQAESKLENFEVDYPVRLGQIIEFTSQLLDQDVSNLSINISEIKVENLTYDRKPNVNRLDYLYIVRDPYSNILERPFEFRFAIKNRRPALFLLNDSARRDAVNNFVVCATEDKEGNKIEPTIGIVNQVFCIKNAPLCSPQQLCITLNAIDPDDNPLRFEYTMELPEPSVAPEPRDPANPEKPIPFLMVEFVAREPSMRFVFSVNVTDDELADSQTLIFPAIVKKLG